MGAQNKIKRGWTSFVQVKDASFVKGKVKFKLTAISRIETEDSSAWAALWVRVDNKEGDVGFFDNMQDRPIRSKKWEAYVIGGEMNEASDKINFGGLCSGNGKFFFDDFELLIENENGIMTRSVIDNSSFEEMIAENQVAHWKQGTSIDRPVQVTGFSFSSFHEKDNEQYSLLVEGKSIAKDSSNFIGPRVGYTPQIGVLVSMLNNLSARAESQVAILNKSETDHLMDNKANRIGALIMHLAATEAYFQVNTFEGREFNEEENKKWMVAFELGDNARKEFVGHEIEYYLTIYRQVREKTLNEFKKRNDEWLLQSIPGRSSNYFAWFHVMEHQSSHLGQILLMKKRLPKNTKPIPPQALKNK